MKLEITRSCFPGGTNGTIHINDQFFCHSIELPWLQNRPQVSCIPEGTYRIVNRYSRRFGNHLWVKDVPRRALILVHPANDAKKELRGCIAPVSVITGEGKGSGSRAAFYRLLKTVSLALTAGPVFITIKS